MADVGRGSLRIAPDNEYLKKLVKLIPAEVVALYLTFQEVAMSWLHIWAWICLGLVIFVRCVATYQSEKGIQVIPVVVATISFAIWIYATGGYLIPIPGLPKGAISVSVGLWTFIVPYFYNPKDDPGGVKRATA